MTTAILVLLGEAVGCAAVLAVLRRESRRERVAAADRDLRTAQLLTAMLSILQVMSRRLPVGEERSHD